MNAVVVYTSRYGSAKKYAQWLAGTLNCPALEQKVVTPSALNAYDTVIYGGGVYAGKIAGLKKFLSKLGRDDSKTWVLFMVGMTNPRQSGTYKTIAQQNLPAEWQGKFEAFALQGDILFSQMSGLHRWIMRMPKMAAEKKPPSERTREDLELIDHFGGDILFANPEQLGPLLAHLQAKNPAPG